MKRVRYLAGAAGLAPMTIGALAAGAAHAAAAEVTGHAKAVYPYTAGHRNRITEINRVTCSAHGDWLRIFYSNVNGEQCYANAGHLNLRINHFDYLYTGNNGVFFELTDNGHTCTFSDPLKNTYVYASSCGFPYNAPALVYLDIFPGA